MKVRLCHFRSASVCLEFIDLDVEQEKTRQTALKEKFEPLLLWLAAEGSGVIRNGKTF